MVRPDGSPTEAVAFPIYERMSEAAVVVVVVVVAYEADRVVAVEVEVEEVHEREEVADVERAGRGVDAGVEDQLSRVDEGAELAFGAG